VKPSPAACIGICLCGSIAAADPMAEDKGDESSDDLEAEGPEGEAEAEPADTELRAAERDLVSRQMCGKVAPGGIRAHTPRWNTECSTL
jgi:hypothetical protein